MHFIFGYLGEVPEKIERETSKAALVGIAILVVFLFIFLSFEDIDGETLSSYQSFQTSSGLVQSGGMDPMDPNSDNFEIDSKIHPEQSFWIHPEGDLN
jgi:hypothetical protein